METHARGHEDSVTIIKEKSNMKKQFCIDIAGITQLYLQLYITYQLHVSTISDLASSGWMQL